VSVVHLPWGIEAPRRTVRISAPMVAMIAAQVPTSPRTAATGPWRTSHHPLDSANAQPAQSAAAEAHSARGTCRFSTEDCASSLSEDVSSFPSAMLDARLLTVLRTSS